MRQRRQRRGANALEFALLMPVLVALIFGTFEVSYAFNRYMVVSAATRDATRRAAMARSDEDPARIARQIALESLQLEDRPEELAVSTEVIGDAPNRTLQVTVARVYTPIAGGFVPHPHAIRSSFTMRMEDQL